MPLLATKLHVPLVRQNLVSRPRVLKCLTPDTENRLILLSAPPGFGKTTLLCDWIATQNMPVAWLSLDRGDNDPVHFWTYVIAAIQKIQPGKGEAALGLLCTTPVFSIESVLIVFINDLESTAGCFLLILDDYHVIENSIIHSSMAFLTTWQQVCMW